MKLGVRLPWGMLAAWVAFVVVLAFVSTAPQRPNRGSSDAFWRVANSVNGIDAETYDSLEGMTQAADVVAVGVLEDVTRGRTFVADREIAARIGDPYYDEAFAYYALANLRVREVVVGDSSLVGSTLPVEIFASQRGKLEQLLAQPALDTGLFFLRSKGAEARALGFSNAAQQAEQPYFRLVTSTALVRDFDGIAATLPGADEFLARFDATRFDDALVAVRDAAGGRR